MLTLSQLQMKEIVIIDTGKRLGFIDDILLDETSGAIEALIILDRHKRSGFFQKSVERLIKWQQIVTLGDDIILINDEEAMKQLAYPNEEFISENKKSEQE